MARPTNSGESDMATEEHFNVMNFPPSPPFLPTLSSEPPPSPPLYFPTSSNSIVVYPPPRSPSSSNSMVIYRGSGQSSMDNALQNRQQSVSMAAPTNSEESDMATEEYLIYWNSPLPSSNSMVVYYQASGQSSMDNPLQNRQHMPANSGDQSDMATEEHFDVMSLLNLPQWSPPPSPCLSAKSMVVYPQGSGQSSMDFVDWPLYIAGDLALPRQKLLQFWTDASEKRGPRGGIMSMKKENLPQSLECLGFNLLHLYVEDEFDTLLYWQGESSWEQLSVYLREALPTVLQGEKFVWECWCDDLERKDYAQVVFATTRVSIGVWQIGPREWVAKIRYQRRFLELLKVYVRVWDRDRYDSQEAYNRVVFEDAQRDFPNLFQDFLHAVPAAQVKDRAEDAIDYLVKTNSWQFIYGLLLMDPDPHEDFVNGEVEPVRIEGEGTEEAEIAESQLDPGPSRKRQRKEKTPAGKRGNKKTTRVKNVIPLDKILQVKERSLKGAAEFLKVSRSTLKCACREHGINRWPPRNKHEGIMQSLPNETPAVVDEEGIPQLTAEETLPLQFLSTVRQENPGEGYGNDEVEAVGLGGAGTGEGEMKRNEVALGGERGKCKTTGVRIEIALEEILRYKEIHLKDAARELKVSRSTLKRVCRDYNIHRWPPREEHKLIGQSHPKESPTVVDQERIPQLNSNMLLPSNQITATSGTNSVTIKAKYKGLTIKFQLFSPWRKQELEQEVKKRLQLDAATYYIVYKDEDDEKIIIGCDEDLEGYIASTSHLGTRSIELEPK